MNRIPDRGPRYPDDDPYTRTERDDPNDDDRRESMTLEDFEVHESGTFKVLDDKDLTIAKLRAALDEIIEMDSCLLADAQAIAKATRDE